MNKDWSDEEDNDEIELVQPSRDMPESEDEEEEDYDMDTIRRMTTKATSWSDIIKDTPKNNIKSTPIVCEKKILIPKKNIIEKRKFNPRLPPPDKYNKLKMNNEFKFNDKDFPTL